MRYFVLLLGLLFPLLLTGQNVSDAVRYSFMNPVGSARSTAVGNSLGALGADWSTTFINPAGLASYRESEMVFTPALTIQSIEARLESPDGVSSEESQTNFHIPAAGLVVVNRPDDSDWTTFNFAFGVNRLKNFHGNFRFTGTTEGSITDRFIELGDGTAPEDLDQFETGPAYDAYALIYNESSMSYDNDLAPDAKTLKYQQVQTDGAINEMVFSTAANYREKLQIGLSVGVPFLSYNEQKRYEEEDLVNDNPFRRFTFDEMLDASAVGINVKFGAIYKIKHNLRLGFSFDSPTWYSFTETFTTTAVYDYEYDPDLFPEQGPKEALSPEGIFEYNFSTPWKVSGSVGVLFGKSGFLTADVDYLDYRTASFNLDKNSLNRDFANYEDQVNQNIDDELTGSIQFGLGGEFALDKLRLRIGGGFRESPYKNDQSVNPYYSGGIGVREEGFFIDLAYRIDQVEDGYLPYQVSLSPQPFVERTSTEHHVSLTFGVKF